MRRAVIRPRPAWIVAAVWIAFVGATLPWPARAAGDPDSVRATAATDSWFAADKQLHATGSLAIAASIRVCGGTEWQSFGGAVGIGILKEAIDAARKSKRGGRGASLRDLVADIVGAAAGVAIVAAMDR